MLVPLSLLESSTPCRTCHAGCCRSFVVPLTGHDLRRIRETTGRGIWDFACRWEDDGAAIPREFAPRLTFPDAPGREFVVGLKQVPSELLPPTDRCEFLVETPRPPAADPAPADPATPPAADSAADRPACQGYCAVHPARPGVCRLFPLKWGVTHLHVQRELPEYGRQVAEPAYRLCPRDWTESELRASIPLSVHDEVQAELMVWQEVAQLWNETGLPADHFPEYLEAIYSRLPSD